MTATNFPEFNAAVTELTTKVSTLLGDVAEMQSVANVQVAVDKAAEASASATEAAASEAAAASSAASATSSKDSASASATKAGQWAEANEGEAVEAGKYSAKHHAIKAAASASSASASATTATTKAGEASTSAASSASSAGVASSKAGEAAASANTASTKAGEAATSATNAANSATTATTKASEASTSATNAAASASTATTKATEASTSATTAGVKATEASNSATSASTSSTKAGQWAENAENVAVETGKYSAKHHAIKAAASASAAAASQSSASTSAGTATTKAGEAATSATNAANSAATATTKASEAATSATNAANANTAAQSAKAAAEAARDEAVTAASSLTGTLSELGSVDLSSGAYPATPTSASFWKVTVGGTVGGVDYGVGDTLVYSKNLNQFYKIDNTESVSSVNGKTGVVSLTAADVGALPSTGNAASATKLATARTINGVAFDGTTNITIADSAKLPLTGGTLSGDLVVGATTRTADTAVKALASDGYKAGFEAQGGSQGTGYVFVGQAADYGGGVSYNGDGTPAFAAGEAADRVSFYRRSAGVNEVVFSYSHDSNNVAFRGVISGNGSGLTSLALANVTGLQTALDSKVSLTGDQSVAGVKTFSTALAVTGTSKAAGRFYAGTTDPDNTTRTNYDGKLHATGFGSGRFVMEYNAATESLDFNFA